MDEETRMRIAKEDLERYREKLLKLWGDSYHTHEQYGCVVREVAAGRSPLYALFDRLGL